MPAKLGVFSLFATAVIFLAALSGISLAQDPGATGVSVTTWQNDTHRTGRNLNEALLVASNNALPASFGQLCFAPLDGQVYAQLGSPRDE
jgi:hypothetical protein